MVAERFRDGHDERVLRGITHDIGSADATSSAPRRMVLAQQVIAAEKEPGRHHAIVNLRNLTLLRWIDDPMPAVAWENNGPYQPAIHPDNLPAALEMSDQLATAERVEGTVRLRSVTGSGYLWR